MKRIGFALNVSGQGWLGGVSYYRNLLSALLALPARQIEPVVITAPNLQSVEAARAICSVEPVTSRLVDTGGLLWKARRATQIYLARDLAFEGFARMHGLALLSHSGHLGARCPLPTLPWIPDFQELHYPEFFSDADRGARARFVQENARHATAILLSSEAARADLLTIDHALKDRAEVLHFVADVLPMASMPDIAAVRAKYAIGRPYFHLPNQFWAHKNHIVIVEALAVLKAQGFEPIVVATGNTADHRQAGHFPALMARVAHLGLEQAFVPIGAIPYPDLMAVMRGAIALINPSYFEGWSTTVEEAKSLGKGIVLSDLPVHREQAPPRGRYFDPSSKEAAAAALQAAWNEWDAEADLAAQTDAEAMLLTRRLEFARAYQDIALRTIARAR